VASSFTSLSFRFEKEVLDKDNITRHKGPFDSVIKAMIFNCVNDDMKKFLSKLQTHGYSEPNIPDV
jgi:hypothetical protein